MTAIALGIGNSPVVYVVLSALNMLLLVAGVVAGTGALFRVWPRKHWYLYAFAGALALFCGGLRPFAFASSLENVQMWNVLTTLLPYLCALLLYPIKAAWKAMLVCLGYEFVAAVKYVVMLLFFQYDNDDVNDPLELAVELLLNVAVLLILLYLAQRFASRGEAFSATRSGITLYLLIVATVVVLSASMSLLGSAYTEEDHAQFAFTLLNIPLFAATATYAALSVSKSRQQEKAYKEQLTQQIKHYEMMEQMNEDLREFRHDLPKLLRPFAAYVENEDTESAKEIAQKLTGFASSIDTRFNTGNYRLDTVLFCQQQIAQKDNITINYVFGSIFPADGIDPDDLYTIFPNALDNAIEACRKVEGPREITITSKIVGGEVLVTITNPVAETVRTYGGLPQTSKRDTKRHGYGFRSMKKAAAKYGGDNLDFRVENGMFILRFNLRFQPDGTV
jgi:signal transduction histidine kinase